MNRRGPRYEVRDSTALRRVLEAAIEAQFGRSAKAAARAVGVAQSTMSRILNGEPGQRVSAPTLRSLERLVGLGLRAELRAAFFPEDVRELLEWQVLWEEAQAGTAGEEAEDGGLFDSMTLAPRAGYPAWMNDAMADQWRAWQWDREARRLITALSRGFPAPFARLLQAARRNGHSQNRLTIACVRLVEPFLSGGLERHPEDLSQGEMERFLNAGAVRECILLRRPENRVRAQRASA